MEESFRGRDIGYVCAAIKRDFQQQYLANIGKHGRVCANIL